MKIGDEDAGLVADQELGDCAPSTPRVRAFLASAGIGALAGWAESIIPRGSRVAFVDAAAQPMVSAPFVETCRSALVSAGLDPVHLDLVSSRRNQCTAVLDDCGAVFVTGGFPLFLVQAAQKSGFLEAARQRANDGSLVYIGVSAGAALAGQDMAPLAAVDDPGQVHDTACLALVPFVPIPHVNRRPPEAFQQRKASFPSLHLVPLRDDEAILVAANITVTASP